MWYNFIQRKYQYTFKCQIRLFTTYYISKAKNWKHLVKLLFAEFYLVNILSSHLLMDKSKLYNHKRQTNMLLK